jgi:hypothetical protein
MDNIPPIKTPRRVFHVGVECKLPHTDTHMKAGMHEPGYMGVVMAPTGRIHSGDMLLMSHEGQDLAGFVYSYGDRPECIKETYDVFNLEPMGIKAILAAEVEDRVNAIFTDPAFAAPNSTT